MFLRRAQARASGSSPMERARNCGAVWEAFVFKTGGCLGQESNVLSRGGEPAFHRVGVDQAGLLELKVAAGEYREVRYPADVVPGCQFGELLSIDLQHDGPPGEVTGDLGHVRRGHAARTTPCRPEIHEDWDFAVANNFVELRGAHLRGFGHRRQ